MSTQLDLQEQEQLDALKQFWKQYGNLVTWLLVAALAVYAGFNGWSYWQRDQAAKAGSMFTELERAATAGDAAKTGRVFGDLKERHSRTIFAAQAGLLAAKVHADKAQPDAARDALKWVADNAADEEYRSIAQLRLAGLWMDAKKPDEALKALEGVKSTSFSALAADRRGDVLLSQGKRDEAKTALEQAYKGLNERMDYRQIVAAKLTALGAAPEAAASASGAASGASK
jgi:predicted negative regulator of RcsB-dependent stress response